MSYEKKKENYYKHCLNKQQVKNKAITLKLKL